MTDCRFCGATGLVWAENLRLYVHEITGRKHGKEYCVPKAIALYKIDNGVAYPRKDNWIAFEIVNEAMRLGYKQFDRIRTERKGDFLFVKP